MNIVVYCGANKGKTDDYIKAASEVGKWIADNGHTLVYGAGGRGVMGAVSDAVLNNGGKVTGIIPDFMVEREWERKGLTKSIHTQTMSERRNMMMDLADITIALPGGIGTLDEISEAICMMGLTGNKTKCYLLNINGYYDYLEKFFDHMVSEGLLDAETRKHTYFPTTVDNLIKLISD